MGYITLSFLRITCTYRNVEWWLDARFYIILKPKVKHKSGPLSVSCLHNKKSCKENKKFVHTKYSCKNPVTRATCTQIRLYTSCITYFPHLNYFPAGILPMKQFVPAASPKVCFLVLLFVHHHLTLSLGWYFPPNIT